MTAYVVVELGRLLGDELAGRSGAPVSAQGRKLKRLLAKHGAVLLPSAGSTPFTTIEVPDMERANRLAAAVRGVDGVKSAYAKPGEELP